jgi:hypothetical protein
MEQELHKDGSKKLNKTQYLQALWTRKFVRENV